MARAAYGQQRTFLTPKKIMPMKKLELYVIDRKSFGSWIVAIIVAPYGAWKEMMQITPDLRLDGVVLAFLFICWLVVSVLLYRTIKANAKKKV